MTKTRKAPKRSHIGTYICCCETIPGSCCGDFPATFDVVNGHYVQKHHKELPYSWDKIVIEKRFEPMNYTLNRFSKW